MIEKKIKAAIRDVPDFPKRGILFKDLTPILLDAKLCKDIVSEIIKQLKGIKIDAILSVESRGFFFGILLAQKLQIPFIPVRKKGKLPGDTIAYKYDLEYGTATVEIHKGHLKKGNRVLIHDDLLATGGTAAAASELVKMEGAKVAAFSFIVNLKFLKGEKILKKYSGKIFSLASYS